MNAPPLIRLELENMRHTIVHAFGNHSEEVQNMVKERVEAVVSTEEFKIRINNAVDNLLDQAIEELASNYDVKRALKDIVVDALRNISDQVWKSPENGGKGFTPGDPNTSQDDELPPEVETIIPGKGEKL